MNKIPQFAKSFYYLTIGRFYDFTHKPKTIYEDAIVDRMRMLGIKFSDLNAYLSANLEGKTRKFPEILKKKRVMKELAGVVDTFFRNSDTENISYDEKRVRFLRLMAMGVADAYKVHMKLPEDLRN
jgi:hypothetical protein